MTNIIERIHRLTPGPEYAGRLQGVLAELDQGAAALTHELLWANPDWSKVDWSRVCSALEDAVSRAKG